MPYNLFPPSSPIQPENSRPALRQLTKTWRKTPYWRLLQASLRTGRISDKLVDALLFPPLPNWGGLLDELCPLLPHRRRCWASARTSMKLRPFCTCASGPTLHHKPPTRIRRLLVRGAARLRSYVQEHSGTLVHCLGRRSSNPYYMREVVPLPHCRRALLQQEQQQPKLRTQKDVIPKQSYFLSCKCAEVYMRIPESQSTLLALGSPSPDCQSQHAAPHKPACPS